MAQNKKVKEMIEKGRKNFTYPRQAGRVWGEKKPFLAAGGGLRRQLRSSAHRGKEKEATSKRRTIFSRKENPKKW